MQHRPWKQTKYQPTALIAVVVLLLIIFSLVGYFFMLPELDRSQRAEQVLTDVELQWERWQASKPPGYQYVIERDCYCPGEDTAPYTVVVSGDAPIDARVDDTIGVEDLFRIARDAASSSTHVEIVFDSRYGYPTRVTIDDLAGGRASVQEYRIRDFEVTDYGQPGDSG